MNRLRLFTALSATLLLLAPLALPRTRRGDKLLKEGSDAESRKEYEKAIDLYEQALQTDPNDPGYQMADKRARFRGAEVHAEAGQRLQKEQKLQEALVQFQKAYALDSSYIAALQQIRNTEEMIREKTKLPPGTKVLTPEERAEKAINTRVKSLKPPLSCAL